MAISSYVGVGGKARKTKKLYVGVNGVARKVKRAYVGLNGTAELIYSTTKWVLGAPVTKSKEYNVKGSMYGWTAAGDDFFYPNAGRPEDAVVWGSIRGSYRLDDILENDYTLYTDEVISADRKSIVLTGKKLLDRSSGAAVETWSSVTESSTYGRNYMSISINNLYRTCVRSGERFRLSDFTGMVKIDAGDEMTLGPYYVGTTGQTSELINPVKKVWLHSDGNECWVTESIGTIIPPEWAYTVETFTRTVTEVNL